jgi:hypothetical protein
VATTCFGCALFLPSSQPLSNFAFQTGAGVLYGLWGIDFLKSGGQFPPLAAKVNACIWGLWSVTPGFIAVCAVLVCSTCCLRCQCTNL